MWGYTSKCHCKYENIEQHKYFLTLDQKYNDLRTDSDILDHQYVTAKTHTAGHLEGITVAIEIFWHFD